MHRDPPSSTAVAESSFAARENGARLPAHLGSCIQLRAGRRVHRSLSPSANTALDARPGDPRPSRARTRDPLRGAVPRLTSSRACCHHLAWMSTAVATNARAEDHGSHTRSRTARGEERIDRARSGEASRAALLDAVEVTRTMPRPTRALDPGRRDPRTGAAQDRTPPAAWRSRFPPGPAWRSSQGLERWAKRGLDRAQLEPTVRARHPQGPSCVWHPCRTTARAASHRGAQAARSPPRRGRLKASRAERELRPLRGGLLSLATRNPERVDPRLTLGSRDAPERCRKRPEPGLGSGARRR